MNWLTEWRAISDRIGGLVEATTVYLRGLSVENSDGYGTRKKQLLPASRDTYVAIKRYSEQHAGYLPQSARETLERFIKEYDPLLTSQTLDNLGAVVAGTTALAGLKSEMQYHLGDAQAAALRLVERSFVHLQRQLVADESYRLKWKEAFEHGEPACERLGSVHLLQHGIWAFKVSAVGERTDLVLAEPLRDLDTVASVADALVLTEWKLVRSRDELTHKLEQARSQASRYAVGVLAGVELSNYRYLVMVSVDHLSLPDDVHSGGVCYRARNIAVDPRSPSRERSNPSR